MRFNEQSFSIAESSLGEIGRTKRERADAFPRLIYIAGYGRSGSTLLDAMLGNHPSVFGAGELTNIFEAALDNKACSCGLPTPSCPFWREVLNRVFTAAPDFTLARAARVTRDMESFTRKSPPKNVYDRLWSETLRAIKAVSGKSIIVDSSKSDRMTFHRLLLLSRLSRPPIKAIHLIRDPRGVLWSICRGSNNLLEERVKAKISGGMLRGFAGWVGSNLAVGTVRLRHMPGDIHRVLYEELVTNYKSSLDALGRFLDLDLGEIQEKIDKQTSFDPGHGVSGNRMRRKGTIVLRLDAEWEEKLPALGHVLAALSWPLMKRYGISW